MFVPFILFVALAAGTSILAQDYILSYQDWSSPRGVYKLSCINVTANMCFLRAGCHENQRRDVRGPMYKSTYIHTVRQLWRLEPAFPVT